MNLLTIRWLVVLLYLVVDIGYVFLSRTYYESHVRKIQNKGYSMKTGVYVSAVLAYVFLAVGWWILVAERLNKQTTIYELLRITLPYSLVIFGVFNTTLYVMFDAWDARIAIRDTVWGISSITLTSLLYLYLVKSL